MSDKPVHEVEGVDAALDALSSPSSSDVFEAVDLFSSKAVASVAAQRALSGGGGGSSFGPAASVVLGISGPSAMPDIHAAGVVLVAWDLLLDSPYTNNTIADVPAALGMTIDHDGIGTALTPLVDGVWILQMALTVPADATWIGDIGADIGYGDGWAPVGGWSPTRGSTDLNVTVILPLLTGQYFDLSIATQDAATANPFKPIGVNAVIQRVG